LGATGRTGKLVLKIAVQKGLLVNCLVRKPEKVALHDTVTVFHGSPENTVLLEEAAQDCEAIISVLNISRTSDFPWSKLRTPKNFLSSTMANIIKIANKGGIKKVVTCSAWGVAETRFHIPLWFKWMIDNSNIGVAYQDHELQEKLLMESNLDWIIIRPTGLTNSKKPQKIRVTVDNNPKPSLTISRMSVAKYMVDMLFDKGSVKKALTISKEWASFSKT